MRLTGFPFPVSDFLFAISLETGTCERIDTPQGEGMWLWAPPALWMESHEQVRQPYTFVAASGLAAIAPPLG
jgi:hypothetical protein